MKLNVTPLLGAIEQYIAKADDDLKDSLEAEGYVAASELVKNINKLEDAIDDVLDADSLKFLEKIEAATWVPQSACCFDRITQGRKLCAAGKYDSESVGV